MNLSDILAGTDLRVVVDVRRDSRPESTRSQIAVKLMKAEDSSDFLHRAVSLEEPVLAAITTSGTVYILSPGVHGLVCLQGTTANKVQKATMEKLAKAYLEATGLMLPDWYAPKLDPKKIVKEPTVPEEVDATEVQDSPGEPEVAPESTAD
jgi:hypothetical protein